MSYAYHDRYLCESNRHKWVRLPFPPYDRLRGIPIRDWPLVYQCERCEGKTCCNYYLDDLVDGIPKRFLKQGV